MDNRESEDALLQRLEWLATLLDSRYRIPGTDWRFGLDGLLGLVPGIGDAATGILSLYLVAEARRYGIPRHRLAHMLWNVAVDVAAGSIPVIGDIFDVGWKANRKNVDLLRKSLNEQAARR